MARHVGDIGPPPAGSVSGCLVYGCVVFTERAPIWQQFDVAPVMSTTKKQTKL